MKLVRVDIIKRTLKELRLNYVCCACGCNIGNIVYADIDGKSFAAYYCNDCGEELKKHMLK